MKKYLGSTGLLWKLGELKTQTTILYVVEKCVTKLEDELLRICPEGVTITPLSLAVATANLSTRIRNTGLPARKMWLQRDQLITEPTDPLS